MTRCIVCGFDGTSGSRHAASLAARLARDLDSRALLVHVLEGGGLRRRVPPIPVGGARRIRKSLRAAAEEHCFPDGTAIRVKAGDPARALIALADREDAEMIVVGAGGRSTISSALLGSVSSTLMRDAPCPVVVVPRETVAPLDSEGMRAVVCGVAGEDTDPDVLRLAEDLATRLGGDLHAVHAYDPDTDRVAKERLASALEAADVHAYTSAIPMPADQALGRVAEQLKAGLIVVGSREGGKLGAVLHGSVPGELAGGGRTAVVVLPLDADLEPGSGHYELAAGAA